MRDVASHDDRWMIVDIDDEPSTLVPFVAAAPLAPEARTATAVDLRDPFDAIEISLPDVQDPDLDDDLTEELEILFDAEDVTMERDAPTESLSVGYLPVPSVNTLEDMLEGTAPTDVIDRLPVRRIRRDIGSFLSTIGAVLIVGALGAVAIGLLAADRVANTVTTDLSLAEARVSETSSSLIAAEGQLGSAATDLTELEFALSELGVTFDELERALNGVTIRAGSPAGEDLLASIMPDLLTVGEKFDEVLNTFEDLGMAFDPSVPVNVAFRAISRARAEAASVVVETAAPAETVSIEPAVGFSAFTLQYPVPGYPVTDVFGVCRDGCTRTHAGVDMNAPSWTPVLAAGEGVVSHAGWLSSGAGFAVVLDHGNGWATKYFHLITGNLPVARGDVVSAGDEIGWVGASGNSATFHLHFEVEFYGREINPMRGITYIDDPGQPVTAVEADVDSQADTGSTGLGQVEREPGTDVLLPPEPTGSSDSTADALVDVRDRIETAEGLIDGQSATAAAAGGFLQDALGTVDTGRETVRRIFAGAGIALLLGIALYALGRRIERPRGSAA